MQKRKVDWAAPDESSETGFKEVNRIRSDKSARVNRSQKLLDNGQTGSNPPEQRDWLEKNPGLSGRQELSQVIRVSCDVAFCNTTDPFLSHRRLRARSLCSSLRDNSCPE